MILANVAAAETLERASVPLIYRVHDEPDPERVNALREFLKTLDISLPKGGALRAEQFNRILERVKGRDAENLVNDVVLRTQAQAEYAAENYGHFGLNLRRYAHFTSPIRRYADLVVHRGLIRALKLGDGAQSETEMGPLVTADHRRKVVGYIEKGVAEGAKPLCDGREKVNGGGFFVGPTIFDNVRPDMTIAREEIFGPVLSVIRVKTLDDAIALVNSSRFGNTTSIFTASGKSARDYAEKIEVGMVGVNIGVAAPMAFFPFSGWKDSFFGDLHAHGRDAISFYTEQKVIMTRWF
jgi:hypothetical protein